MAKLDILAPFIFSWEGGYSNKKSDKGGATNRGVTIATWKSVGYDKDGDGDIDVDDLKLISEADARDRVLRPHYWNRWRADEIHSQSLANSLVDWVWGSGKWGITIPQQMLGVKADGVVGKITLAALNAVDAKEFFDRLQRRRRQYLYNIVERDSSQKVNLKGWLTRLACIRYGELELNAKTKTVTKFEET